MNNFETTIGIEIHLELNTKTKMFSPAPIDFNAAPNTCAHQIDLAYPGTLPLVNRQAVIFGVKLAKALNMKIDNELHFDRKNYFYTDLPKGFQITQFYRPIGQNGQIKIDLNDSEKIINIERIHLEEDTARQHHDQETQLDFNRAGVPLIEIVSQPEIHSADEAVAYVDAIRKVALTLGISNAKMEQGSLRADLNVSIRPIGSKVLGTKIEIKNLNSFRAIKTAIEFEINWQKEKLLRNEKILQQTKRFDEASQSNILMRTKTSAIDYKYFPEPNIPFIKLSNDFINQVKIDELPWEKKQRYQKENIPTIFANSLLNNIELSNYFDSIKYADREKLAKLFFAEVVSLANSKNVEVQALNIKNTYFEQALQLLGQETISSKSFKKLITLLPDFDSDLLKLIKENNLQQISDPKIIKSFIEQTLKENPNLIQDYKQRPDRAIKQILGNIMKISNGQVNPTITNDLVIEALKNI
ncbi:Asp-tRNA(Asn)/Glu-tRNA(Gln) amidotransferase subunit GatB [Mycoplasmopsis hyopharyngis]|uniref:Asp-tRNA(Asn)/Glu-tRNA(Gln) amidotransferase subunit GatB n=1 Tax=Mycoplasmopsis hyopharyngis TaxID=29558 RepID=UPI0038731E6D